MLFPRCALFLGLLGSSPAQTSVQSVRFCGGGKHLSLETHCVSCSNIQLLHLRLCQQFSRDPYHPSLWLLSGESLDGSLIARVPGCSACSACSLALLSALFSARCCCFWRSCRCGSACKPIRWFGSPLKVLSLGNYVPFPLPYESWKVTGLLIRISSTSCTGLLTFSELSGTSSPWLLCASILCALPLKCGRKREVWSLVAPTTL